jgi:hypothetical protein
LDTVVAIVVVAVVVVELVEAVVVGEVVSVGVPVDAAPDVVAVGSELCACFCCT